MVNGGVMKQDIIGFCEYFATGEGVTYVVASGSEEAIRDFAGPYFSTGLTFLSFAEMRTCLIKMEAGDDTIKREMPEFKAGEILRKNLPNVAALIREYGYCSFAYKLHYNLT
tara:strand:+ start:18158 stop:18493 length:336 start_codon:yes stop_codon:yes gene_type:complete